MTIIFLNGAGSSGKTSIAKAIQILANEPYIALGIDSLINMMPAKYLAFGEKSSEGFEFITKHEDGKIITNCQAGELGKQIIDILPKICNIFAESKINIIIDEVILSDQTYQKYLNTLSAYKIYFIGVDCDLEIMEEREILREDRVIGLSRAQYNIVHSKKYKYDLIINTSIKSPFANAKEILEFIKNN